MGIGAVEEMCITQHICIKILMKLLSLLESWVSWSLGTLGWSSDGCILCVSKLANWQLITGWQAVWGLRKAGSVDQPPLGAARCRQYGQRVVC